MGVVELLTRSTRGRCVPGTPGPGIDVSVFGRRRGFWTCTRGGASRSELEECASQDAALKRDLDELFARTLPHQVETLSRRVIIMQRHVESACGGYVPRRPDAAELAGWSEEGAPPEKVQVANWYRDFVRRKIGDRLRAAVTEPAVLAALNYLEQQPPRPRRPRRFTDAEQTSRRVLIMQRHVESACGGYVPRANDTAKLAGWSEEGARPQKVLVGFWYRDFVRRKIGDRLRAAVTEPAVLAALNYLEQQPPRPERHRRARLA